jgi:hypothetical protein
MTQELQNIERDDTIAKQVARDIYCTMGVVALTFIAKRVNRDKKIIEQWKEEGDWQTLRTQRIQSEKSDRISKVGTKQDNAIETINAAKAVRKLITAEMQRLEKGGPQWKQSGEISELVEALRKADAIMEKQFAILEGK